MSYICITCGKDRKSNKYFRDNVCASCYLTARRTTIKEEIIKLLGGKCQVCGYNKCIAALDFHHINPEEKIYGVCDILHYSWKKKLKPEVEKCALICANCHREVHAGLITLKKTKYNLPDTLDSHKYIIDNRSKDKKYQRIHGTKKDYNKVQKERNTEKNKDKVELLKNSDIDFRKYGWCVKASKVLEIQPQSVRRWMKRYMLEFYNKNCN